MINKIKNWFKSKKKTVRYAIIALVIMFVVLVLAQFGVSDYVLNS